MSINSKGEVQIPTADNCSESIGTHNDILIVKVGQIWRHCNGKLYEIVAVSTSHDTGEFLVTYRGLYDNYEYWTRTYSNFTGLADESKYPNHTYRFVLVHES